MPVHTPPHKAPGEEPGPEHRLAMCRLAVAGEPGVSVCTLELDRPGPSYTADTLTEIHARHPELELTFVVGVDTALTLPSWHEPRTVLKLARLAIARRPGVDGGEVATVLDSIAPAGERAGQALLEMEPMDVSSSLARARVAAGEPLAGLLSEGVSDYITAHGLYREGGRL